jgi:hypothetical protein
MGDGLDIGHWRTSGKASSPDDPESEYLPYSLESTGISRSDTPAYLGKFST